MSAGRVDEPRGFLQRLFEGEMAELTRTKLAALAYTSWARVRTARDKSAIKGFMTEFPDNQHAEEASSLMAALLQAEEDEAWQEARY
jgi:hypothetical protein